jgi:hypothetical protein
LLALTVGGFAALDDGAVDGAVFDDPPDVVPPEVVPPEVVPPDVPPDDEPPDESELDGALGELTVPLSEPMLNEPAAWAVVAPWDLSPSNNRIPETVAVLLTIARRMTRPS